MTDRVFLDSSVLVRGLSDDDPPRALAAARLLDGQATLVLSTSVLIETVHALRVEGHTNPELASALIAVLTRDNVELVDADVGAVIGALRWSLRASARRIPDALIAAAAQTAGCDWIATFDEAFASPSVPVRTI